MHRFFLSIALLIAALLVVTASPAWANARDLTQKMTRAQLETACNNAGGVTDHMHGGIYGCKVANCDKKGGECSVWCSDYDGSCIGSTPNRLVGALTLLDLLLDRQPARPMVTDAGPDHPNHDGPSTPGTPVHQVPDLGGPVHAGPIFKNSGIS